MGPRQNGPAGDEHHQQHRRHQAAAQVVENLPARNQREPIALDAVACRDKRKQPQQNLPVAADPAVLAAGVCQHAGWVFVHQLDVRDERDTSVQPFEQIVRQQRIFGDRVFERRGERVDVVQAFAGEDSFAEQILVGIRHGGGVRIDAGMAGVEAREQRAGGARECHADPRLQNAIAFGDAADFGIEAGPIGRMGDDADQLPRCIARQPRIAIKRDAVANALQHATHRRPSVRSWYRWRRAAAD